MAQLIKKIKFFARFSVVFPILIALNIALFMINNLIF